MSPTVFRWKGYRFFFFSREEERIHVHVYCPNGEAKFWIEPEVGIESSHGLSRARLSQLKRIVEERRDEIKRAWSEHFRR